MLHPYDVLYLGDAKRCLADAFDYAVNCCGMDIDRFAGCLVASGAAERFGSGNPAFIAGMSGAELGRYAIERSCDSAPSGDCAPNGASPEWWAGWSLAEWQWESGRRLEDILIAIPPSDVVALYALLHEADPSVLCDEMERRMSEQQKAAGLASIRRSCGLSQEELARLSGVNVRSIQMYEQGVNDIAKAQAQTIRRLASVLGCRMEDLI